MDQTDLNDIQTKLNNVFGAGTVVPGTHVHLQSLTVRVGARVYVWVSMCQYNARTSHYTNKTRNFRHQNHYALLILHTPITQSLKKNALGLELVSKLCTLTHKKVYMYMHISLKVLLPIM